MRAIVFIDYQNMYRSAREAFGWENEAGQFGTFRPLGLSWEMAAAVAVVGVPVVVLWGLELMRRDEEAGDPEA
jgi:hypothetical protein